MDEIAVDSRQAAYVVAASHGFLQRTADPGSRIGLAVHQERHWRLWLVGTGIGPELSVIDSTRVSNAIEEAISSAIPSQRHSCPARNPECQIAVDALLSCHPSASSLRLCPIQVGTLDIYHKHI